MPDAQKPYTIYALGDTALTIDFGHVIDCATNEYVLLLFQNLKELHLPFLLDIVPAYSSLTVYYDVIQLRQATENDISAFKIMERLLESIVSTLNEVPHEQSRFIKVPVCYSTKYAPDIKAIAYEKGITTEEVVQHHVATTYRVYMIGFMPGFPYMGEVDDQIATPRKQQPRLKVEAGSVGIAGKQTGIYPQASPGGWQIIGRTPVSLFDSDKQEPTLLKPGDVVQFYPITEDEFKRYKSRIA